MWPAKPKELPTPDVKGLDIRKNTGMDLIFQITRPPIFHIEFVQLMNHRIRGLDIRNSG